MILQIEPDVAYLVIPKYCSFFSGHLYLSKFLRDNPNKPTPSCNGPILMTCKTIRNVVNSADE